MTTLAPLRCTYCGQVSDFSAEELEEHAGAEAGSCSSCEEEPTLWDDSAGPTLDAVDSMDWQEYVEVVY